MTAIATAPVHILSLDRPSAPTYSSTDAHRLHRKQQLAAACRVFAKLGFAERAAGHLSARDPDLPDHFWMTPLTVPFGRMRASDLQLIDVDGFVVEGSRPMSTTGFAIHAAILAANPAITSVVHAHATHGKAWSTLGRLLDPITLDACTFFGSHAILEQESDVVLDPVECARIAAHVSGNKMLILKNHGLLAFGREVDEAAWHFIAAERCCEVQLLAEAAGAPTLVDADVAVRLGRLHPYDGLPFAHAYEEIVAEQPDLLE